MKSRNPSVSANAEPAPLAGEPERVIPSRSRPQRPSSVSLTRASTAFYGIAAGGSYTIISWKRGVMEESGAYLLAAPARNAPPQSR